MSVTWFSEFFYLTLGALGLISAGIGFFTVDNDLFLQGLFLVGISMLIAIERKLTMILEVLSKK